MSNVWLRKQAEKQFVAYIRKRAPKKYHDFLIPDYPIGCKRIIVDPGYLKCLHQDNVELVYDPIETITENGIKCASGKEHQLDVLILGTGFNLSHEGFGLSVHNADGECLTRQWEKQGGPQAYLGTTIGGFPNFFMLLGPNVATVHTSAIAHIECQVNYTVKVVQKLLQYKADVLELRPEAEKQYNSWLHRKLDNTVWKGGCQSYYKMPNGKVIAMWPGTFTYFWWKTLRPNFSHYTQIGGKADIASSERQKTLLKATAGLLGLLALGAGLRSGFSV